MKKLTFPLLIISLFFFSCRRDKYTPVALEEFTDSREIPLFDTVSYPSATLSWTLEIPADQKLEKDVMSFITQAVVQAVCDTECNCRSIEDAVNFYSENYLYSFRTDNSYVHNGNTSQRLLKLVDAAFEDFKMDPVYNKQDFFCFTIVKNSYNGGAHSMWDERAYILDLKAKKVIDYSDIFENMDTIPSLLIDALIKEYNVWKYEDLYEIGFFPLTEFSVTENIVFSDNGMMWIFNPYEIASYTAGVVKVTIPYKKLSPFVKKESPIQRLIH